MNHLAVSCPWWWKTRTSRWTCRYWATTAGYSSCSPLIAKRKRTTLNSRASWPDPAPTYLFMDSGWTCGWSRGSPTCLPRTSAPAGCLPLRLLSFPNYRGVALCRGDFLGSDWGGWPWWTWHSFCLAMRGTGGVWGGGSSRGRGGKAWNCLVGPCPSCSASFFYKLIYWLDAVHNQWTCFLSLDNMWN